jgi:hypothetical protein
MKRLCFLAPDVGNARSAVASFKSAGIPEEQIYALARFGTDMEFLPDAGPEANDFLPAYTRGAGIGGTAGVLVGLSAMAFPPAGIIVGGGLAVLLGLFGAGLGGLLTGMVGAGAGSTKLREFESAIEQGRILLMVDVPKEDMDSTVALIRTQHPAISMEGLEPPHSLIP